MARTDLAAGQCLLCDRRRPDRNDALAKEHHRRPDAARDLQRLCKSERDDQRGRQSISVDTGADVAERHARSGDQSFVHYAGSATKLPYTFNNNGWITDGGTKTDGNNIQAGIDRDGGDGVDPNSEATSATRDFTFAYNPYNPNTNTGDAPVPVPQTYPGSAFQQGTVTQLFWISNWYHDETYRVGFTEAARNFQQTNFTGQGVGNDRVRGEGQDSSGTNNANFSTPADGGRGRMQMYLWSAPNPDIDGNLDADVVIHELTHGTSNRLHGNASGLSTTMSSGMGEGWSDFYAHCMLSEPSDPINGIYTTGAYDTYLSGPGVNNGYYGIRRFPKAVIAFTGGPLNRPHNPLTFADVDSTQMNLNDGAYAPRFNTTADQVHAQGEVWSSALWEVRAKLIQRLGWEVGNRKTMQLVTDGMKLAPLGPTFVTERDAILAAAQASSEAPMADADVRDVWAGFALRGVGANAAVLVNGSSGSTRVVESFALPNVTQSPAMTVSDANGNNNGFPEPGEQLTLTVPISNATGVGVTAMTLIVAGGGSANYGAIPSGSTVSQNIAYTVPANTPCGSVLTLNFTGDNNIGVVQFSRPIVIGAPTTTAAENFDAVTVPNFPAGWTAVAVQNGVNFVTSTTGPDAGPNSAFAADPLTVGGGTDLTMPAVPIVAPAALVTFRNKYNTEPGWDGGVLEISINGGAFAGHRHGGWSIRSERLQRLARWRHEQSAGESPSVDRRFGRLPDDDRPASGGCGRTECPTAVPLWGRR